MTGGPDPHRLIWTVVINRGREPSPAWPVRVYRAVVGPGPGLPEKLQRRSPAEREPSAPCNEPELPTKPPKTHPLENNPPLPPLPHECVSCPIPSFPPDLPGEESFLSARPLTARPKPWPSIHKPHFGERDERNLAKIASRFRGDREAP